MGLWATWTHRMIPATDFAVELPFGRSTSSFVRDSKQFQNHRELAGHGHPALRVVGDGRAESSQQNVPVPLSNAVLKLLRAQEENGSELFLDLGLGFG
jgi:hypothetical protein